MPPALVGRMATGVTLIVDDDASLADALRAALGDRAAGVEFAADVGTAKALLATNHFCGVVLDPVLEGGRGVDVLDYMQERRIAVPTVIVSSEISTDVRKKLDAETVKLVFPKPIDPRLLASVVLALCGIGS